VQRFGAAGAHRIIQRRLARRRNEGAPESQVQSAADHGTRGAGGPLPHLDAIQESFGAHDVSRVQAHTDEAAAEAAAAMGAAAFATGDHVPFAGAPDLHTAAHEAAHVVQQRGGVQLRGGVGQAGDVYEQHADAVADRVAAGGSAEALLSQSPASGGAGPTLQRKDKPDDAAPAGHPAPQYQGVTHKILVDKTALVSDPTKPKESVVATLDKGDFVKPLDLGAGEPFNQGADAKQHWWKIQVFVPVKGDTNQDKEGWVHASVLGSNVRVKKAGTSRTDKLPSGKVTIGTGQDIDSVTDPGGPHVGFSGDDMFSLRYQGKDAGQMRWLQFIWRELITVDDKGASTAQAGSLAVQGDPDQLALGGTKDKFGTPTKDNLKVDSGSDKDPFYEATGTSDRGPDSTTILDEPGAPPDVVKAAFDAGAKMVILRAHTNDFLVKDEKSVVYQTGIDIEWRYTSVKDIKSKWRGKQTAAKGGAASALPPMMAERLHEQYPAYKDLK
jgi:hypothetical protein